MDKIEKFVDTIDRKGGEIFDKVMIPIAKNGVKAFGEDNSIFKFFLQFKSFYIGSKIEIFINYLQDNTIKNDTVEFLNSFNQTEKRFFIESVNKVIDMDDDIQIYILAYLVKEYKMYGELNYQQRGLYYNIKSLSQEDFKIFYYALSHSKKGDDELYRYYAKEPHEIISMEKLYSLAIIFKDTGTYMGSGGIPQAIAYYKSDFTDKFIEVLRAKLDEN